jgi:hypothetical protein
MTPPFKGATLQGWCITILWLALLNPVEGFELTRQSRISILTIDPGQELYTIFGHTAIRVKDVALDLDRIYNFGTFDSNSPFFYVRFLRGDLVYFLSITDFEPFFRNTVDEKRRIVEQNLDFTYPEISKLYNVLEKQYHSSARFYRYDFFYDNCATRVRDVIFNNSPGKIKYDTMQFCCKTFRELLKPYITRNYWIDLGINLTLGMGADKNARSKDFMFLPDYIRLIVHQTPVAAQEQTLLDMPFSKSRKFNFSYFSPWVLLSALVYAFFKSKYKKFILNTFLIIFSTAGLILFLITSVSLNQTLTGNLNIWWTLPSLALLLVQNEQINYVLEIIYCIFLVMLIFAGWIMLRGFSFTFLPWMITMAILLFANIRRKRNIRFVSPAIS